MDNRNGRLSHPLKRSRASIAGMPKRAFTYIALILTVLCAAATAQETPYMKPPQAILDILNGPETDQVSLSPMRDVISKHLHSTARRARQYLFIRLQKAIASGN